MRIFLHQSDDGAISYYRSILPYQFLKDTCDVHSSKTLDMRQEYDVYVFNRLLNPAFVPVVEKLQAKGKQYWASWDDDLFAIPVWNPVFGEFDLEHAERCLRLADKVIASTEPLADVCREHGAKSVVVCPNLVDLGAWPAPLPRRSDVCRIVWAGSSAHAGDLELVLPALRRVVDEYGERVQVIFYGVQAPDFHHVRPTALENYPATLAALCPDIGLCPLTDETFNYSKSPIKFFEYSLAGAAVVASPVGPYRLIRHEVDGMLTDNWYGSLKKIVENVELRQSLAEEGLRTVREKYAWSGVTPWHNLFGSYSYIPSAT